MKSLIFIVTCIVLAVFAGVWYFAGIQYVVLMCGVLFVMWLIKEFWPLIAYLLKGQR